MFRVSLILAGFTASVMVSLSLTPLQILTNSANISVIEAASNKTHSINQSNVSSTSSYLPSISTLNHSDKLLRSAFYTCDASRFGRPSLKSCRGALQYMSNIRDVSTYGDRTISSEYVDFPMPIRYVSSKEEYNLGRS